ncbi:hypothetical protein F4777DRAFT_579233 [Nemania sp. FL0916]|nr:hypothetical protein F4777DRAFT_579233 [Nemania sp. FL0916]
MGKNYYRDASVYTARPYHSLYLSDDGGEDDDLCVWDYRPELSDSENEPLTEQLPKTRKTADLKNEDQLNRSKSKSQSRTDKKEKPAPTVNDSTRQSEAGFVPSRDIDAKTGKLTEEAFRERELQYSLSTARRNLTHASQFLLKLEARAGKTSKEGIRQTLDATVKDTNYDFKCDADGGPLDPDHKSEIEEIKCLSGELFRRLHLLDRHWRQVARQTRDAEGRSPPISLLSEGGIRDWIKVEIGTNHLSLQDTCFYTVSDLANNRTFESWITYLRSTCKFREHPSDQAQLLDLAWRFLDRNLRGPRPVNPTPVEKFISDLEERKRSGVWTEILKTPNRQELDDEQAWKTMRRYWSSRTAPG